MQDPEQLIVPGSFPPMRHPEQAAFDLEALIHKLKPQLRFLPAGIAPYGDLAQRAADDVFWSGIRGMRGIRAIASNAKVLEKISLLLAGLDPKRGNWMEEEIVAQAKMLLLGIAACAAEQSYIACFRSLPIPRTLARYEIEEYAEMCSEVRAIVETLTPELIELFDSSV